jgi:hypothetical protein
MNCKQDRQFMYKHDIEARSCNHCCSGKASITYRERVCIAIVNKHAMCMCHVASVACPALQYFSKQHDFRKNWRNIKFVLISSTAFCLTHLSLKQELCEIWSKRYIGLNVKYPLFLPDFNETWIFLIFFLNTQISNFIKIHSVGDEMFQADRHDEVNSWISQFSERA